MRQSLFAVFITLVMSWSTASLAQELVIFTSGQTASAADINANFQTLLDEINAERAAEFGPEWYLQPSADGQKAARNVIVLKGDVGGTGVCSEELYLVRTYFANTGSITVGNASGSVVPDEVFVFGFVCAARGNPAIVQYQSEYVYALPNDPASVNPRGAWESAQGMEINEDFNGDGLLDDQNNAYDYALTYTASPLRNSVLAQEVEVYRNGDQNLVINDFTSITSAFPLPIELSAPVNQTFSDLAVETHSGYGAGSSWVRFHARDIGAIQLVRDARADDPVYSEQTRFDAIYYRIGGAAVGSVAGTPLEAGNPSADIWFTP